jgi:hypothetical protein
MWRSWQCPLAGRVPHRWHHNSPYQGACSWGDLPVEAVEDPELWIFSQTQHLLNGWSILQFSVLGVKSMAVWQKNTVYETRFMKRDQGSPTSIFWRHAVEELSRGLSSLCWIMAVGCWARENVLLIGVHYPISWENPNHHWLYIIYINISVTIWLFNIAMENHHF